MVVAVEEWAVGGEMVEHPIQDDAYPELVGVLDQVLPVLLSAEVWIDLEITLRVVSVIGGGVEERVKVKRIHSECLQVVQVPVDPFQVTPHVVTPTWPSIRRL